VSTQHSAADVMAPASVNADPHGDLLRDLVDRPRILDRDVAHHHTSVRRILAALDAAGPTEAGDCIHSLFWRMILAEQRAARFARELAARGPTTDVAQALAASVAP
jgi:hypothetical protein